MSKIVEPSSQRAHTFRTPWGRAQMTDPLEGTHQICGCQDLVCVENMNVLHSAMVEHFREIRDCLHRPSTTECAVISALDRVKDELCSILSEIRCTVLKEVRGHSKAVKERDELMTASDSKWAPVIDEIQEFHKKIMESQTGLKKDVADKIQELQEQAEKQTETLESLSASLDDLSYTSGTRWDELKEDREAMDAKAQQERKASISENDSKWTSLVQEMEVLRTAVSEGPSELKNALAEQTKVLQEQAALNSNALHELTSGMDSRLTDIRNAIDARWVHITQEIDALKVKVADAPNELKNALVEKAKASEEQSAMNSQVLQELARNMDARWEEIMKDAEATRAKAQKEKQELMAASDNKWSFVTHAMDGLRTKVAEGPSELNNALAKQAKASEEHSLALQELVRSIDIGNALAEQTKALEEQAALHSRAIQEELVRSRDMSAQDSKFAAVSQEIQTFRDHVMQSQEELKYILAEIQKAVPLEEVLQAPSPGMLLMTPSPGMLHVVILSGHNILNKDTGFMGDVSDPYVVVKLGAQEFHTPVVKNNLNPVWSSQNGFTLSVISEVKLSIEVKNSNNVKDDTSLGW
eukprot:CAMPEP_0197693524 /NCGR_PEP_ID=MMETSP1338-20131121/112620_1 /TAXON_ID=43686 ORGANISM="Pelagodinium beii, Strain RCC1491" /NCGR_SAMPLE_ID=MMETSP1338 /ASSEMBLY_ACC=CAM_ASM_000754 /LENGTH=583 /DNA_ID=CAMNT_0043276285 /DNA_START=69 /DNA_END=1817 /DNA_ORIENTATION=-